MEWQPIETAPRDGTWLLLANGICDGDEGDRTSRPVTAQWTDYLNGGINSCYGRWQFAWYDGGYVGEYENPTHWMQLPKTPNG